MRLVFIHKGFPAQFRHVLPQLQARGDELYAIVPQRNGARKLPGVRITTYSLSRGSGADVHPWAVETEAKVLRAEAVAQQAALLKQQGLHPDLIVGHPGWGEMLFLHTIWPDVPQLHYLEFFYGVSGTDCDFDDPHAPLRSWQQQAQLTMKNASLLLNLQQMTRGITPTAFQCSLFPQWAQAKASVIHDGIDVTWLRPNPAAQLSLPSGVTVRTGDEVVTFVNRTFEPYRGIHRFLEALVDLQRLHPQLQTLMVGEDSPEVSYGAHRTDGQGWLSALRHEHGAHLDWSRIHCLGRVSHQMLCRVYQVSAVHVYLTYPFVLSWSMLEAMACGCLVIGSDVAPVREVVKHGCTGWLVPFGDSQQLTARIHAALVDPVEQLPIRRAARQLIKQSYAVNACVSQQVHLIDSTVSARSCQIAAECFIDP